MSSSAKEPHLSTAQARTRALNASLVQTRILFHSNTTTFSDIPVAQTGPPVGQRRHGFGRRRARAAALPRPRARRCNTPHTLVSCSSTALHAAPEASSMISSCVRHNLSPSHVGCWRGNQPASRVPLVLRVRAQHSQGHKQHMSMSQGAPVALLLGVRPVRIRPPRSAGELSAARSLPQMHVITHWALVKLQT